MKLHTVRNICARYLVDLGAAAAGNDALLQLLGSRKIAKIATFCPIGLSPAPFNGTSPNLRGCEPCASHGISPSVVNFGPLF